MSSVVPSSTFVVAKRPRPGATHVSPEDTRGVVNASWHPNRATCAVSVGRSVYLLDGATGAVLARARLEGREELDNNGFARLHDDDA